MAFSCQVLGGCWNDTFGSSVNRTLLTRSGRDGEDEAFLRPVILELGLTSLTLDSGELTTRGEPFCADFLNTKDLSQ